MIKKFEVFEQQEFDDPFGEESGRSLNLSDYDFPDEKMKIVRYGGVPYILEKILDFGLIIFFPGYVFGRYEASIGEIIFNPILHENDCIWMCATDKRDEYHIEKNYTYQNLPKEIRDRLESIKILPPTPSFTLPQFPVI